MQRVVILGAGFGGLELATMLSEALGDDVDVTLIDKNDAFVFGYSKLDVMFGRTTLDAVRLPYRDIAQAGRALPAGDDHRDRSRGAARDDRRRRPRGRRPGRGARRRLRPRRDAGARRGAATSSTPSPAPSGWPSCCPTFSRGRAIIGVCGAPFKCPPAPSEAALLLHDYLSARGVRDALRDLVRDPVRRPGAAVAGHLGGAASPPSPSAASSSSPAAASRSLDAGRSVAVLDDGSEMPYDLFLGVPKHRAPDVVVASGMTEDGYVPVNPKTLETRFPGRLRGRRRRHRRACRRPASSPRARRASSPRR